MLKVGDLVRDVLDDKVGVVVRMARFDLLVDSPLRVLGPEPYVSWHNPGLCIEEPQPCCPHELEILNAAR